MVDTATVNTLLYISWHRRRRRRGRGGTVPPQKKKKIADVRIQGNFGQNSGKFRQISGKYGSKLGPFFFFLLVNYFCQDNSCRISCTPKPILKYRTDSGAVKKKKCTSPPPPPTQQGSEVFSAGGIRAKQTKNVCAPQKWIGPVRLCFLVIHDSDSIGLGSKIALAPV